METGLEADVDEETIRAEASMVIVNIGVRTMGIE